MLVNDCYLYSYYKKEFKNILGGNNFPWTSLKVNAASSP